MKRIRRGSNIETFEFEKEQIWLLTSSSNDFKKPVQNWTTHDDKTVVYFKMNASFFDGYTIQGRNVGYSEDLSYIQGRPDQQPNLTRYDLVIYDDMTYAYGQFMSWDRTQSNITCGYSVPLITVAEGKDVNLYSTYLKKNSGSINVVTTYTGLIRTKDKRWIAFNAQNNSPSSLRTYFKSIYDVEFLCMNDGGGSTQTQCFYDGKMNVLDYDKENRSVVNVIAGVIDTSKVDPTPEPGPVPEPTAFTKMPFGMKYLNITQGRFEPQGISHKYLNAYDLAGKDIGIDVFCAPCDLKIVSILSYSATGFANTIMYYDEINKVTLAFTHMNSIDPSKYYIGKVFKKGEKIYEEGTAGNATGNHIHFEAGLGLQTTKVNMGSSKGGYQLKNLINIEDYFYIDLSSTKVINDKGYKFEVRGEATPEKPKETITKLTCVKSVWNDGSGYTIRSAADPASSLVGKVAVNGTVDIANFVAGSDKWAWAELTNGTFIQFDKDYLKFAAETDSKDEEIAELKRNLAATELELEEQKELNDMSAKEISELGKDIEVLVSENSSLEAQNKTLNNVTEVLKGNFDIADKAIKDIETILKDYKF